MKLLPSDVRDLLDYDHLTGEFRWRDVPGLCRVKPGELAGTTRKDGRRVIKIRGGLYLASRLAWMHYYGANPQGLVDHQDENPANDRVSNLRDLSNTQNLQRQMSPQANSTTGLRGVTWDKSRGKFKSAIKVEGRMVNLGRYDDPQTAHQAYLNAKAKYHFEGTES